VDVETLQKIEKLRAALKNKLVSEGKNFRWFWRQKIVETTESPIAYFTFMNCIKGNSGNLRADVQEVINKYVNEKF